MATRTLRGTGLPYDGRVVDVGAAYLTAQDARFVEVVASWQVRGLVREWTDTFAVVSADGSRTSTTGPVRYAAAGGLRSLVEDLAADLPVVVNPHDVGSVVRQGPGWSVDGDDVDAVVLALPGPQASDLLDEDLASVPGLDQEWEPVLSLVAAYDAECWPAFDAMFVNDSAAISFVAHDGRRRGDGAPVLVAHSTSTLASDHLDDPGGARDQFVAALTDAVRATAAPRWTDVRRWGLARPTRPTTESFCYADRLGVCGDAWGRTPRIETAWVSGDALGRRVAADLAP